MALRTMLRRKRRTLITGSTVAFGVFLSVTFTASGDYSYTNMIDTSAKMGFGHVTVQALGQNERPSVTKRLSGVSEIGKSLDNVDGVSRSTVRIFGQAMFASASKSVGGVFIGIDPASEDPADNIFVNSIKEGKIFDSTTGKKIIIGSKMAEKLNLRIGKRMVWTSTNAEGEIVSQIAKVSAIFSTGVNDVDSAFALLPIDRVRKTIDYGPDEATMVSVMLDDQRYSDVMARRIETVVGEKDREVLTWRTTQADMSGMITVDRASNYLFQFLVGLVIAAGILNTIMMSVLERKHEFGVLLAVGMSPLRLFGMVLMESVALGVVGLILGIIVTAPWYHYMYYTGLDLTSMMEEGSDIGGVLVDPVMKFRLYKESALAILAGVFSLTVAAGLYPAIKAGRIPPVDSLKAG